MSREFENIIRSITPRLNEHYLNSKNMKYDVSVRRVHKKCYNDLCAIKEVVIKQSEKQQTNRRTAGPIA